MKIPNRMMGGTTIALFAFTLYACGGGTSSADTAITQGQFDNMLQSSSLYASLTSTISKQAATITSLQNQQAVDEKTIGKIAAFGHAPGNTAFTQGIGEPRSPHEEAISYGPCADMGQHIGDTAPDALGATVEDFKQCTGYEYGATAETGTIAQSTIIWFDGLNCTGNMYEEGNDGGYNRQVLQSGVVFTSPMDKATVLMVASGQSGQPVAIVSNYSGGSCQNSAENPFSSYLVTPNNVSVTGVPTAVPANFIL